MAMYGVTKTAVLGLTKVSTRPAFVPFPSNLESIFNFIFLSIWLLYLTPCVVEALASEMAPNTRVNCVVPGIVPTHFVALYTSNDAIRKELERTTLIGRLGTAEEMAAATAFLASDDASYITGENLVVSGGMPSRL
ncbi:hypothetical protein VIGAN_05089900 [Vigna angularis var. angularis]|uniref:Uncharacterized protein n=1 Tax=Vigna angularis var. angularis TaxID=157739 RepID=A0A0S3S3Z0_PHAAN|nr:hypothetical protein VIGAN_05089900 [Vigna angularis var. angularis]